MTPPADPGRTGAPRRTLALAAVLLAACGASRAQGGNCEAIRARIETKIRASGVAAFTLKIVDADAKISGKVVGSCELGTRRIVYSAASAASAAAASSSAAPSRAAAPKTEQRILTECKDGTVTMGGDCKK